MVRGRLTLYSDLVLLAIGVATDHIAGVGAGRQLIPRYTPSRVGRGNGRVGHNRRQKSRKDPCPKADETFASCSNRTGQDSAGSAASQRC
jgi:hypothetical protein